MEIQKLAKVLPPKTAKLDAGKIRIIPKFNIEPDYYIIKSGKAVIGNITYTMNSASEANNSFLKASLPSNWFSKSKSPKLKPHLDINYIEILKEKGKGFGRKVIQQLYKISKKNGGEGRITLVSLKSASGFYSHLGFDCSAVDKAQYQRMYDACVEFAKNKKLTQRELNILLKKQGCPTMTNGKFNSDGIRFFDPTKENVSILFKS